MHINVTIGLLGFLGTAVEIARSFIATASPDAIALTAKIALALLLLVYVILCVRSFIAARRSGKV
jgi:hypothetical protein